jgi:NitT/TauT family transport system ATP-binding protein
VNGAPQLTIAGSVRRFPGPRGGPSTEVLAPLDLYVTRNACIANVGASGCGKSTLLRIIAGLDQPSAGRVLLQRAEIADRGMVFQSYTLVPWLTVAENIGFGLGECCVPATERVRINDEWMVRVGLLGFAHHYPRMLSGGVQQRTALARALANDPKILLLDEPFGTLDHQTRSLMQGLLLGIWERAQKTVLLVTHDIKEALFISCRVMVMTARPGRIKTGLIVPSPYPRPCTLKTAPEFATLKARMN